MDLERRLELITRPPTEEVITLDEANEVAVPSDSVHSGYPANIFYLCFDGSLTIPIDDCLDGGDDISWEQESYLRSLRFLGF